MKKVLITLMILVVSITAFGQTDSPVINEFFAKYQDLISKYQERSEAKDYKQTKILLNEVVALADNLKLSDKESSEFKQTIDQVKANALYNLACTYSLQNKKKEALNAFEKSIELGWDNYRHTTTDTDLDNIRKEKRFVALIDKIKVFDKLVILQSAGEYQKENTDSLPEFTYQPAEDYNLKTVKKHFNLDSIAGNGDEISKILNLMYWVHNNIRHDGSNRALCEFDAIDFYNYYKATGKGVNCRHLSITLNEMYLAMGLKSRYVTCMPKDPNDVDCHVINTVYSTQFNKWLWIDPTNASYVKDENGNFLSIQEVRERLIGNKPLFLNEDANWNREIKKTKEEYLETYMAKNLYWIQCVDFSRFNPESPYRKNNNKYIALLPVGFEYDLPDGIINPEYVTHDPDYFWQAPEK